MTDLLDEAQIREVYDARSERLMAEYRARAGERATVEAEVAKLESDIARGVAAILRGAAPAIEAAVREAEGKLAALKATLAEPAPEVDWSELRKRLAVLTRCSTVSPSCSGRAPARPGSRKSSSPRTATGGRSRE